MKKKNIQHQIEGLMVLVLFGIFAACMLTVLMTGANAYFRLTQRDRFAYDSRTCAQYIAARVHQSDSADAIAVEEFDGSDALVFRDGEYVTRVYCHNGYLMELYSAGDRNMSAGDGEKIIEAEKMELSLDGRLLTVTITDTQGIDNTIMLTIRSGEGASV